MKSRTHRRFWNEFNRLPAHVQCLARDKFRVWQRDPFHPSMQFKALANNLGLVVSEIIFARSQGVTANLRFGFGLGRTRNTTA